VQNGAVQGDNARVTIQAAIVRCSIAADFGEQVERHMRPFAILEVVADLSPAFRQERPEIKIGKS